MGFVGCLRGLGFVYELLQSVHVVVELLLLLREVEQRRVRPSDLVLLALEDQVVKRLRLPGRQLRDELLDDLGTVLEVRRDGAAHGLEVQGHVRGRAPLGELLEPRLGGVR